MPIQVRRVATLESGAQSIQPSLRDADKLATIAQSLKELPKLKRRYAAKRCEDTNGHHLSLIALLGVIVARRLLALPGRERR
jgi:hypothetical protein